MFRKILEEEKRWKEERDEVISFIKSRRTTEGNIIADDVAIKLLRMLYLRDN